MRWRLVVLVILCVVAQARGDNARVSPAAPAKEAVVNPAWAAVVEQLTKSLADSDAETLASLLSDTVVIQSFEHRLSDPLRFMGRTRRAEVLSCRTYTHPGLTIASDVSDDLRASRIPEELRRRLALRDESHARRANSIAYHWVASAVAAKPGDTVTVMVLWRERGGDGELRGQAARSELLWVLVKADTPPLAAAEEPPAQPAVPKIKHIAFGDPERTAR